MNRTDHFYPNPVFFQTGYEADRDLWESYNRPVRELCTLLTEGVRQPRGFFWVDFPLRRATEAPGIR